MAAKSSASSDRVDALLLAWRDSSPPSPKDEAALAWLRGGGDVQALDTETALAAIEVAARLVLGERVAQASEARDKVVRKAARAAAHKLRSQGHSVPEAQLSTSFTLGAEIRVLPTAQALIGLPEEDGYVPYLLSTHGSEESCISGGAAGPIQGFRDQDHGHASRSQVRRIMQDAKTPHRMHELDLPLALALVEGAFRASGRGQPPGWGHMLSHVEPSVLKRVRELDPFEGLSARLELDLLHDLEPLNSEAWSMVLDLGQEQVFEAARQALEVIRSSAPQSEDERRAEIALVVDGLANAQFDEARRSTWIWSMNVVAVVASTQGAAEVANLCRANALAMAGGMAGADIPWVREQANRLVSSLTELISQMGQDSSPQA